MKITPILVADLVLLPAAPAALAREMAGDYMARSESSRILRVGSTTRLAASVPP